MNRLPRTCQPALLLALYLVPLLALLRPVTDADLWWHLAVGRWIVENRTLPTTDPFSTYGADKPWIAYSWLFDLLIYEMYDRFGLIGVLLYRAVLGVAVLASLHHMVARREPRFLIGAGLLALAFVALVPLLSDRPWLFSILFATWTLEAILRLREGRKTAILWALPLMFSLWANLHIQFIHGLLFLALACIAPWLDRLFGWGECGNNGDRTGSARWRLLVLTAACGAATLVNPYHLRLYGVMWEYAFHLVPARIVQELRPWDLATLTDWSSIALAGWTGLALGIAALVALVRNPQRSSFDVLLLGVGAILAIRLQRDLWLLVLASLAVVSCRPRASEQAETWSLSGKEALGFSAAVVAILLAFGWLRGVSESSLEQEVSRRYPVAASAFVEEQQLPGPLYNHFNWGGYLIWRLPHLPVAIDGRTNLHGDERLQRFHDTWAGLPGWEQDPDLADARLVIADPKEPLIGLLRRETRFRTVYEDEGAVVLIRTR